MNRTSTLVYAMVTSGMAACGEDSSGSGSTASASATTTTATTSSAEASVSATASSSNVGGSGGGDGGAPGAGGDASTTGSPSSTGSGGVEAPSPEECFAIHDEALCYEAGCNLFLFKPEALTLVDDVCQATDDLGMCFLEQGGGQAAPAAYVRDFEAEGPRVVGLNNVHYLYGWTRCTYELTEEVPECCCDRGSAGSCDGVTPLPPSE